MSVDRFPFLDLGKIPHPPKKVVRDARACRATVLRSPAQLPGLNATFSKSGCAVDDFIKCRAVVIVEPKSHEEAGAHRRAEESGAGCRPDQSERVQLDLHGPRVRARVDHEVEIEILHGRVEIFFRDFGEAVDFVDEEDVPWFQVGQKPSEIARFLDGWA